MIRTVGGIVKLGTNFAGAGPLAAARPVMFHPERPIKRHNSWIAAEGGNQNRDRHTEL
jgi:hypothetical protein